MILISLLAAAMVWRWGPHRRVNGGWRRRGKQIFQSLLAGVVVYFCFMSVAALYLMLTHQA
ncbi:MAG: hypothetical protein GX772_14495 [Alcaligenaceae bacterium]|nr:hypothetical protein [Alcaligenaceae bacterium]